jgi:hypothetical protein
MNYSELILAKILFDQEILLVKDQKGMFYLFDQMFRLKIGEFGPDFHSLVVGVETCVQNKSEALLNLLNNYWEERYRRSTEAAN